MNHDRDKKQYAQFKGKLDQQPIGDSRNEKYTSNKNNWQNNRFKNENVKNRQQGQNRDNGNDNRSNNRNDNNHVREHR